MTLSGFDEFFGRREIDSNIERTRSAKVNNIHLTYIHIRVMEEIQGVIFATPCFKRSQSELGFLLLLF